MSDHPPSITETAFDCPHCGAFAKQQWHLVGAKTLRRTETPEIGGPHGLALLTSSSRTNYVGMAENRENTERLKAGRLAIEPEDFNQAHFLSNASVSRCDRCDDIAFWVHEDLYYPRKGSAPAANADLPEDIRKVYDEASAILNTSPRGAAALLRLAVQKLCIFLGHPGKHLNTDIKNMVANGLDVQIQQSLDAVRVIGNESVHPGQIDLNDDRDTAVLLFNLVNLICNRMITQPREIDEVYRSLPQEKLDEIAKRDGTKSKTSSRPTLRK